MPTRRPDPEDLDEEIALLKDLEAQRAALKTRIDDVLVRLVVEKRASPTTVAERLNVSQPLISGRCRQILERRAQRQASDASSARQAA